MALTASSTLTEVITEFKAGALYSIDSDVALAKRFIVACTMLIAMRPTKAQNGNQSFEYSISQIQQMRTEARTFVAANDTTASRRGRTKLARFNDFHS